MIEELDEVALLVDRAEAGLTKGLMGTVVCVYGDHEAFEVEFVDDEGQTFGLETFKSDELLKLHRGAKAA